MVLRVCRKKIDDLDSHALHFGKAASSRLILRLKQVINDLAPYYGTAANRQDWLIM